MHIGNEHALSTSLCYIKRFYLPLAYLHAENTNTAYYILWFMHLIPKFTKRPWWGSVEMESSCNPLGFGGGVSFSEFWLPFTDRKGFSHTDRSKQRYDDVPDGLACSIVLIQQTSLFGLWIFLLVSLEIHCDSCGGPLICPD